VYPGRLIGGFLGLVLLGVTFGLPFSDAATGPGTPAETLYGNFAYFVWNIGALRGGQNPQLTLMGYVYIAVGSAIIVAGLLGGAPFVSGALGIAGMTTAAEAPFLIYTGYSFSEANYGSGFWAAWVISALILAAAFWTARRSSKRVIRI
jgi:hypothetical protein